MDIKNQARALMMRHHNTIKNRQRTMLNRAGAELGIEPDNYWSQIKDKPNPSFGDSYDRSGSSMS